MSDQQTIETGKSSSFTESLSGSTIYKRNEARRIKTMQNIDDSRPAVVRVLSGLPGFRNFIQPYQPEHQLASSTLAKPDGSFVFSDQTVFSTNAVAANASEVNERRASTGTTKMSSSALAIGLMGTSMAMMLRNTKRSPIFAVKPTTPTAVPMFTSTNSAAVAFLKPACPHHSRILMSGPAKQSLLVVSFLAFVGYRNFEYYYGNKRTQCSEE